MVPFFPTSLSPFLLTTLMLLLDKTGLWIVSVLVPQKTDEKRNFSVPKFFFSEVKKIGTENVMSKIFVDVGKKFIPETKAKRLLETLLISVLKKVGSDCSTAVEHKPAEQNS